MLLQVIIFLIIFRLCSSNYFINNKEDLNSCNDSLFFVNISNDLTDFIINENLNENCNLKYNVKKNMYHARSSNTLRPFSGIIN